MTTLRSILKRVLPAPLYNILNALKNWKDPIVCISFLRNHSLNVSLQDKLRMVRQLYLISFHVDSPHTQEEIVTCIETILSLPANSHGVVVEAGCYKGSSTAKFSLAADMARKELVVFDSFQGIPKNVEPHQKNIFGGSENFEQGDYCGTLEEVRSNVSRFGKIQSCRFVPGWFDDTMPGFQEPISAIYLDVDLASSTRTCLIHLYPLLEAGGVLYSQDGHLPLVVDVFDDADFWRNEIGCQKPSILGLGKRRLIKIVKEAQQGAAPVTRSRRSLAAGSLDR
jgi:O-methyltransferase